MDVITISLGGGGGYGGRGRDGDGEGGLEEAISVDTLPQCAQARYTTAIHPGYCVYRRPLKMASFYV